MSLVANQIQLIGRKNKMEEAPKRGSIFVNSQRGSTSAANSQRLSGVFGGAPLFKRGSILKIETNMKYLKQNSPLSKASTFNKLSLKNQQTRHSPQSMSPNSPRSPLGSPKKLENSCSLSPTLRRDPNSPSRTQTTK
jgi:hypothetical protein